MTTALTPEARQLQAIANMTPDQYITNNAQVKTRCLLGRFVKQMPLLHFDWVKNRLNSNNTDLTAAASTIKELIKSTPDSTELHWKVAARFNAIIQNTQASSQLGDEVFINLDDKEDEFYSCEEESAPAATQAPSDAPKGEAPKIEEAPIKSNAVETESTNVKPEEAPRTEKPSSTEKTEKAQTPKKKKKSKNHNSPFIRSTRYSGHYKA